MVLTLGYRLLLRHQHVGIVIAILFLGNVIFNMPFFPPLHYLDSLYFVPRGLLFLILSSVCRGDF